MFYIPASLKKFHTLCVDHGVRFATGGVHVEHTVSDTEGVPGKITVASTDTKHLVSAEFADDIIPEHAAAKLKGSPNGVHTGLIAASDWKKMFAGSRLHGVAGQFGMNGNNGTVALAAVDQSPGRNASIPGTVTMREFQPLEGRFPPYQQFFPKERDLVAGIVVDPALMGSVCDVLKSAGVTRMLMRFTKDTLKPITIEGVSRDSCIVKYKAILMPMGYEAENEFDIETPYGQSFINPDLVDRKPIARTEDDNWSPENHITIAADSIDKLRACDVDRLFESALPKRHQWLWEYLMEHRSDLSVEIAEAWNDRKQETSEDPEEATVPVNDEELVAAYAKVKADAEANWVQFAQDHAAWVKERGEMKRQIAHLESQLSFQRAKQQAVTTDNPTPTVRKRVALG